MDCVGGNEIDGYLASWLLFSIDLLLIAAKRFSSKRLRS